MLRSAELHYRRQQQYAAAAVAAARRAWRLGDPLSLVPALTLLQGFAARDGAQSVRDMLAEQDIAAPPVAVVNPRVAAGVASDGRPLGSLVEQAATVAALEAMVLTQVADAFRTTAGVAITARPRIGWTRMVNPPCCARCAVLAGVFFKWNQGFQRHPLCDCRHIPTQENQIGDVRTDPTALFRQGRVTGVTVAEQKAITDGADAFRVVNARRSLYMNDAGRRLTREGVARSRLGIQGVRPTPEQIYRDADDDQAEAVRLLRRFGYLF